MKQADTATNLPKGAPRTGGLSFRTELLLSVCGLVLLTGAAITWLAHLSARQATETLTNALFREVSAHAVSETRAFTERAAPVVETLRRLANDGLALDNPEPLAHQLLAFLQSNPGLSWVSYSDEAGRFTGAYRTADGKQHIRRTRLDNGKSPTLEHDVEPNGEWRLSKPEHDSAYDPRVRPFYTKAKSAGRLAWLPPYIFYDQGVPGITCCAPILSRDGQLRGVITADFDLNALTKFVSRLSVSPNSRFFMYTNQETLLAHPTRKVVGQDGQRTAGELLTLGDMDDPLVKAFRGRVASGSLPATASETFERFEFKHDDVPYMASTTSFRVGDDQVWVIGAVAPMADFLADVWRSQASALMAALGALLIAMLLAAIMARSVSKPVEKMIGFMNQVGSGDLESKAAFGGSREFRNLADALNRMIADLRDRLRLRHSLGVAMEVQQRLLPSKPPKVRGLDVAGHSTYCDETGGDYYDFVVLDKTSPDSVLVVLGDVMGHGIAAALVMAGVRSVLRDRATTAGDLAELMSRLNRIISADHRGERFMTMHLAVIDAKTRCMRWVSAGHDPVIVYDTNTQSFSEIGDSDLALGIMDEAEYHEQTSDSLKPGQILFIGTDGVWELPDVKGDQFGKDRLRGVIRETAARCAEEIATAVRERLIAFRGDAKSVDDVTFVIIKVL